ncbi:MAG TPA: hypothetical protein VJS44_13110 [Pyrinomonadaceae bacterium]|nr:hypothetical protein [Pyrinomonadaceae bacterium]
MRQKITDSNASIIKAAAMLFLAVALLSILFASVAVGQVQDAPQTSADVKTDAIIARFEGRVKEYSVLRERLEDKLPKLSKDATPEQIKQHKTAFEEIVRSARPAAKQGDLFTPDIAQHIRKTIRTLYTGQKLQALREEIMEAETTGVAIKVNYTYPESKELTQIPPTLLLKLPQLPKQVKYRFVGRHMLLVDRENGLIVDYMLNALP